MREIKFRAWTYWEYATSNKYKMIYSEDITEKGKGRALYFPFEIDDDFILDIMQYTGLKDKNGKEIYEGDILYYEFDEECYSKGMVTYNDGWFCNDKLYPLYSLNEIEVIGNIYENEIDEE